MEGEDEAPDVPVKSTSSLKTPSVDNRTSSQNNSRTSKKSVNYDLSKSDTRPTSVSSPEHTPIISKTTVTSESSAHVSEIPEEAVNCDEVIQELVESHKGSTQASTTSEPTLQHDPECPMYEEESKVKGKSKKKEKPRRKTKSTSYHDKDHGDSPCPPGVRICCTCGVCPLDLVEEEEKGEDEESRDASYQSESTTKSSSGESREDKDDDDLSSDVYDLQSYDTETDYSRSYRSWYGEGWTSRKPRGKRHKRDLGMRYASDAAALEFKRIYGFYPPAPMSDRSRHEGSFIDDYMKFFIEPFDVCYKSLSSVTSSFVSCEETGLQRTIVIVKPDAVKFKEAIYRVIFESGFQILGLRVLHLTPEQVSEIYSKYYGSPSFVHLVVSVSDAPVLAICISAMNVIKRWLNLIGPDGSLRAEWFYPLSMRKLFGLEDTHADWIHGSENLKESNKENRYFYPNAIIEPIIDELDKVKDYCALTMNKTIVDACTELVKKRPADPIIFFADYLLVHNPFQPRFPQYIAMTPT